MYYGKGANGECGVCSACTCHAQRFRLNFANYRKSNPIFSTKTMAQNRHLGWVCCSLWPRLTYSLLWEQQFSLSPIPYEISYILKTSCTHNTINITTYAWKWRWIHHLQHSLLLILTSLSYQNARAIKIFIMPTQTFLGVRHAFLPGEEWLRDEPVRTSAWEANISTDVFNTSSLFSF